MLRHALEDLADGLAGLAVIAAVAALCLAFAPDAAMAAEVDLSPTERTINTWLVGGLGLAALMVLLALLERVGLIRRKGAIRPPQKCDDHDIATRG
jgi:hypothetical protein